MATFEAQVEGLTSLSIDGSSAPTQTELTQFLTDGAKEIFNAIPSSTKAFYTTSNDLNSSSLNFTVAGSEIFAVTRDDGTINQPCRQIPPEQSGRARDSSDMSAASTTDPVYYIINNLLSVIPEPTNSNNAHVQAVSYPSVAFGDSSISKFPDEAEYLVPLYASIKSLQNALGNRTSNSDITTALTAINTELDDTLTIANDIHAQAAGITAGIGDARTEIILANAEVDKMATEIGLDNAELDKALTELGGAATLVDSGIDTATAAITTAAGRINTAVALANDEFDEVAVEVSATTTSPISLARTAAPSIIDVSDLNINAVLPVAPSAPSFDAGAISISASAPAYSKTSLTLGTAPTISDLNINAVLPVAPSLSTVSYSDATNSDASVTDVSTATATAPSIINVSGNAPAYTKPSLTSRVAFDNYWTVGDFGDNDPGDLNITVPFPIAPSINTVSYSDATNTDASATAVSTATASAPSIIDVSSNAPTYTKPSLTTRVALSGYTSGLSETDPGVFTMTAVAPSVPSLTSITFSSLDSDVDASAPTFTAATVSAGGVYGANTPPTYTKPSVAPDFAQVNTHLDTNEDVELAAVKIQEIQTQITEYNANIQNEQNEFNKENIAYQANIQEAIQELQAANQIAIAQGQASLQVAIGNKDRSQQRHFQNAVNDMKVIFDSNAQSIQKYQSEVSKYQADVSKDVQEYQQKLAHYSLELNTSYQAWAKTESDSFQQYQLDIQNELNEFNKDNARYQIEFKEAVDKNNADLQVAIANANNQAQELRQEAQQTTDVDKFNKAQDQALNLANAAKQMEDLIADNSSKLQKYSNEVQSYQSQVNKEVQSYTQNLSRYTTELNTVLQAWQKTESDSLQQFQLDMQNELNEFNKENAIYQVELQEAVDKNNADLQVAIANANNLAQEYRQEAQQSTEMDKFNKAQDQALALANAAKQIEDLIADNNSKIQKYSSELQSYQNQINKDVQEYQLNLEGDLQVWYQERQTDVQKYSADIQDELNEFNKEQTVFQNELQEKIQEAQNQQTKDSSEYGSKIQRYSSELQSYQAQINKEVQEYQQNLDQKLKEFDSSVKLQQSYYQEAESRIAIGNAYLQEANASSTEVQSYVNEVSARVAQVQAQVGVAQGYIANGGGYSRVADGYGKIAQGFLGTANGYLQSAQAYVSSAQSYASEIQSKIGISQGYANEVQMRLTVDTAHYGWLEKQQAKLQADYDKGIQILMKDRS